MDRIINIEKLEELLVANWTQFVDSAKLLGYVLQTVQKQKDKFAYIADTKIKAKGAQIMLSRFSLVPNGFIIWIEFHVPVPGSQAAVGTTELYLTNTGSLTHIQTLGNIYSEKNS